jgi:uncharacterized protein
VRIIRFTDLAPEPWRNGAGTTRTVASHPPGADFDWRVSLADVTASGPFSAFPGIDRVIMLCDGPGMHLSVDGDSHELQPYQPLRFAGEAVTSAQVTDPTRDLNLMTRRGRCSGELIVGTVGTVGTIAAEAGQTVLVLPLDAPMSADAVILHPLDALVLDDGTHCELSGEGRMAIARIRNEA